MKRLLIALAVVSIAALVVADQPIRELDTTAGGGADPAMPVNVMNFPAHFRPVVNQVIDLLDEDVNLPPGVAWESEIFDTSQFTALVFHASASLAQDGSITCLSYWQLEDGPFIPIGVSAFLTTPVRAGKSGIYGVRARIRCVGEDNIGGVLTDVKVLLRRE